MCIYDDGNSVMCFEQKKPTVMQILGNCGVMGTGGKNMWSKVPYLESTTLICLVVFGELLPVPKLCKKISTMCIYDDGNSVFRAKKLLFVMQNLGNWGIIRTGGQNMWSKVPYLKSPTLIFLFTMQLLWGYTYTDD